MERRCRWGAIRAVLQVGGHTGGTAGGVGAVWSGAAGGGPMPRSRRGASDILPQSSRTAVVSAATLPLFARIPPRGEHPSRVPADENDTMPRLPCETALVTMSVMDHLLHSGRPSSDSVALRSSCAAVLLSSLCPALTWRIPARIRVPPTSPLQDRAARQAASTALRKEAGEGAGPASAGAAGSNVSGVLPRKALTTLENGSRLTSPAIGLKVRLPDAGVRNRPSRKVVA
jgi:hypothetical protein